MTDEHAKVEEWKKICTFHSVQKYELHGFTCTCGVVYAGDCYDHQIEVFARDVDAQASGMMLDRIRASLREYPNGGGDVEVMKEVERVAAQARREALEEAARQAPPETGTPEVLAAAVHNALGEHYPKLWSVVCGPETQRILINAICKALAAQPDQRDGEYKRGFEDGAMSRKDWWEAMVATYFAIFKKQPPESMKACEMSHAIVDVAAQARREALEEAAQAAGDAYLDSVFKTDTRPKNNAETAELMVKAIRALAGEAETKGDNGAQALGNDRL